MPDLPFAIPESLASYLIQFESAPQKTISRLKSQLKKRGPDPVGYFVLGWLYHRSGVHKKAVECALKAKMFAPGSPFFARLNYYFSHPQVFDAWESRSASDQTTKNAFSSASGNDPVLELDRLIERLSSMESPRIKKESTTTPKSSTISASSNNVDGIVSETLAKIHEQQGKNKAAIKTYRELKKHRPEKSKYYDEQINRLQRIISQQKE